MHRAVAAVFGLVLVFFGAFSYQPLPTYALVGLGVMFIVVAAIGRPRPRLSLPVEVAVLAGVTSVSVAIVSVVAWLIPG